MVASSLEEALSLEVSCMSLQHSLQEDGQACDP